MSALISGWMLSLFNSVGNFALTVVIFTLILKTAMLPFDFWQKKLARKNAKIMKRMQPKLDALRAQCGDDQQGQMLYWQKSRELQKKEGYNAFGACLPAILTIVIFITVFGGFNATVRQRNIDMVEAMVAAYDTAFNAVWEEMDASDTEYTVAQKRAAAKPVAEEAVREAHAALYEDGFFWIRNIFMPDTFWAASVPTWEILTGTGMGRLNISETDLNFQFNTQKDGLMDLASVYEAKVQNPLSDRTGRTTNGFMLLPIIAIALNFFSMKLAPQAQQPAPPPSMGGANAGMSAEEREKMQKNQMKMMMYMMPVMFGVISLFYSSAFTLYIMISSMFTVAFNLIYNFFAKKNDEVVEEAVAAATYMTRREYEEMKAKEAAEAAKKAAEKKPSGGLFKKPEPAGPKADDVNFQKVRLNLPNNKKPVVPVKTYENTQKPNNNQQNKKK